MKQQTQQIKPQRIKYDEIVDQGTHVTGIARLDNPAGPGAFEFRVSGQETEVVRYGEEAVIQQLELHVLEGDEHEGLLEEGRMSALELRRAYWRDWLKARCEALRGLIDAADLELLADKREWSVRLCLELLTFDKPIYADEPEPDLTTDRLCEIEPVDLAEEIKYRLLYRIDPTVPKGQRDIYVPVDANLAQAWARVDAISGDPDVYLYRGGLLKDFSVSSGATDEVSASGGSGLWRLHVYGFTAAEYRLSGDWILS
jgi:hypothetical protein